MTHRPTGLAAGLPSSYWQNAIRRWNRAPDEVPWWNRALDWVGMDRKPTLLTDDQDPAAIPILFCLVQDEDEAVQIAVGYALDRLEPTSRETVPLLVRALKDQQPAVRYWAATLLGRLGEKAKTPVLRSPLHSRMKTTTFTTQPTNPWQRLR
jgi:HEAT repeat protein